MAVYVPKGEIQAWKIGGLIKNHFWKRGELPQPIRSAMSVGSLVIHEDHISVGYRHGDPDDYVVRIVGDFVGEMTVVSPETLKLFLTREDGKETVDVPYSNTAPKI